MPTKPDIDVRPFRPEDAAALRRVMTDALAVDAYPGLTGWGLDREVDTIVAMPEGIAVATDDGVVCGYVSPGHDYLIVHPAYRRRGHGTRLFASGLELAAIAGLDEISLYVPSTGAGPAFAKSVGLAYRSSLWRFGLPVATLVPEPSFPGDVLGRSFGPWIDVERFVELLNRSFTGHPTPISWSVAEIEHAHARADFDPSAILLLSPVDAPDRPMALVRTSVSPPEDGDTAPVGEIRLVGVVPEWRGRGLGRELLRWGVARLRTSGAGRIQLTVEAENERALGLYRRTGFEPLVEWPHWSRPVPTPRVRAAG